MLRTIPRALPAATGLVLLLALAACGTGDDSKAADAISQSLTAENDELFTVTDEQADCVGEGFVEDIGTDQLTEYGILTEDLDATDEALDIKMDKTDAAAAAEVLVGCTDAAKLFSDAMFQGEDIPEEARACIDQALTEEVVEDFFTATFAKDQELAAEAMGPLQGCMAGQ